MKPTLSDLARRIGKIADSNDTSFATLVSVAGLRPDRDFQDADLVGVDFGSTDLAGYDFTNANLANANLSHVRNFTRAQLSGANLEGAQLPDQSLRRVFATKKELIELTARAARQSVSSELYAFLSRASNKVDVRIYRRTAAQADLFQETTDTTIRIADLCFALPLSIGRTALAQWRSWRPRRGKWVLASAATPRPSNPSRSVDLWFNARDKGTVIIAPLAHRTSALSRLTKVVSEQPMAGPTAAMLGNAFCAFFNSELEDLPKVTRARLHFRQGHPATLSASSWPD